MGIYTDFLNHTTVVDTSDPQVGPQRVAYNELLKRQSQFDPEPVTGFDAQNEVQVIGQFSGTVSSGNYTITVVTPAGAEITTANIVYNANAATIEGAIDSACTGNIAGWTNGDISVSGGPLTTGNVTLTFDGTSVKNQNFGQTRSTDIDLGGGGTVGTNSTTQHGQPKRYAWSILQNLGIISAPPEYGQDLSNTVTLDLPACSNPRWPSAPLRRALAWQAAIDDGNPRLRTQLEALLHI